MRGFPLAVAVACVALACGSGSDRLTGPSSAAAGGAQASSTAGAPASPTGGATATAGAAGQGQGTGGSAGNAAGGYSGEPRGNAGAGGSTGIAGAAGAPSAAAGSTGQALSGAGGAAGAGGEACECNYGACCDGCHIIPAGELCFEMTWEVCAPDNDLLCSGSWLKIATIYQRVECSGLSPLCTTSIPEELREYRAEYSCCPAGTGCWQIGDPTDLASVTPTDYSGPPPQIVCRSSEDCENGVQDLGEEGVDCGGFCDTPCP